KASKRPPRSHVRTLWRSDRDESRQSEASQGDRDRGARNPHRGPVVAVSLDGAQLPGAVGCEPFADLARSRRSAGSERTRMAGGWARCQRDTGSSRPLLLLEGRTTPAPERASVCLNGRDPKLV